MAISIKKITEHIGAEIDCDVHLRELPERDFVDIKKAFDEHSVLVFRGQPLLDEDQINFSERFGCLETTVNSNPEGGGTVMTVLSNVDQQNKVIPPEDKRMVFNTGNQMWHTDSSFKRVRACFVAPCWPIAISNCACIARAAPKTNMYCSPERHLRDAHPRPTRSGRRSVRSASPPR